MTIQKCIKESTGRVVFPTDFEPAMASFSLKSMRERYEFPNFMSPDGHLMFVDIPSCFTDKVVDEFIEKCNDLRHSHFVSYANPVPVLVSVIPIPDKLYDYIT
jgi:hypothetical protein